MHIAVWTNLPSGGGQRALYDQVRGLLSRGHKVEAWAPQTADRSLLDLGEIVPYHVVALPKWTWRAARHVPEPFALLGLIATFKEHCREVSADIARCGSEVLLSATCQYLAAPAIARYSSLPSVLYLQEPHRRLYEALPENVWQLEGGLGRPVPARRWLSGALNAHFLRLQVREEILNARAFTSVLVNSYFTLESVSRAYGLQARVCYLGIDLASWAPPRPEGVPREVLGIGTFRPHKRIELVIDALALLGDRAPPLAWVGSGADAKYLEDLGQRARQKGVEFTPHLDVSHKELLNHLASASVFCCCARLEPFGYGPLEAGAAGLPVVAVAEGGLRETVEHNVNGLLADSNPESFAAALGSLLEDPALRRRLGSGGRRLVEERWGLDAAVSRLESELERAVALGGPSRCEQGGTTEQA